MSGSVAGVLQRMLDAERRIPDPGNAGTIKPDRWGGVCALESTGAETRTVADPDDLGVLMMLNMEVDGGDITMTFSSAYTEAGTTSMVFSATGQFALLESVAQGARTYVWRLIASDGVTGPTTDFATIRAGAIAGNDSSLGITGQAAAQGGAIAITGGTSSTSANAGGAITITGGTPGATGIGGAVTITTGAGQTSSASTATAGGASTLTTAAGGTTATGTGGNGGATIVSTGAGGAASGDGTGGNGGATSIQTGAGGAASGTGAASGGVGGALDVTAGNGGAAAGTNAAGAGGQLSVISGTGGAKTGTGTANGGAGGALAITGGAGGATASTSPGTGGAGATVTITSGAGGAASAGTANGGAAGSVVLVSGAGGTSAGGTAGIDGGIMLRPATGRLFVKQTAPGAGADQAEVLTTAQMFNGIYVHTISTGRTLTTPTGAQISAACPASLAVGDSFDFSLITVGTGADDIVTLTAGDGNVTFVGVVTVGPNIAGTDTASATWRFRNSGTNTWVGYRLT